MQLGPHCGECGVRSDRHVSLYLLHPAPRTCPLCRKCSFFVIPVSYPSGCTSEMNRHSSLSILSAQSTTWVEDEEDKAALIEEYQGNLRYSAGAVDGQRHSLV